MRIESLHIGMRVRHPQCGIGEVKSLSLHTVEVQFDAGARILDPETSELEPAEAHAAVTSLEVPLQVLIQDVVGAMVDKLGVEQPDAVVPQLAQRWHHGKMVLHPADPTLQTKEVPLEVFFHKIVMMRNNLRVLEQKINAHPKLSEAEKIEMQQYLTRCYGSMTTYNVLFKSRDDQFNA